MSLASGTRLGPYQVGAQIGAGGMGEVYRATDTNLGRDVAIKVLPEALAQDPERLARFEREARTLASLNHPNVAIVHGLERSQGTIALVMERVDGTTLADRIAIGAIPVADALPIAGQIAEALEAAHEQGIVHRDLKPANIKLRPDGTVKVLDFDDRRTGSRGGELPPRIVDTTTNLEAYADAEAYFVGAETIAERERLHPTIREDLVITVAGIGNEVAGVQRDTRTQCCDGRGVIQEREAGVREHTRQSIESAHVRRQSRDAARGLGVRTQRSRAGRQTNSTLCVER